MEITLAVGLLALASFWIGARYNDILFNLAPSFVVVFLVMLYANLNIDLVSDGRVDPLGATILVLIAGYIFMSVGFWIGWRAEQNERNST